MPSFFESLRRMVLGKPVFDPADQQKQSQPQAQVPGQPAAAHVPMQQPTQPVARPKVIPDVHIERWNCYVDGANMHCEVTIQNYSQEPMDLDRFELLGSSKDLGTILRPGEEREFTVYAGPRPRTANYQDCKLYFKNPAGDYFCAVHDVDYQQEPDGTQLINRFSFLPPARDV